MSEKNEQPIHEKLAKLSEQLAWFESDQFVLEEAIERFKAVEKLATEIQYELGSLQHEITVLKQRFDKE